MTNVLKSQVKLAYVDKLFDNPKTAEFMNHPEIAEFVEHPDFLGKLLNIKSESMM